MTKKKKSKYERSANYRKTFFSQNKSFRYRCAYCGKRLKEADVEVDHLIPVSEAQSNWLVRLWLRICGITDINDKRNLVSSCKRCNRKKSDKMGLWVYRGAIGRYKIVWIIRDAVVTALLLWLSFFVWQNYIETGIVCEWIKIVLEKCSLSLF